MPTDLSPETPLQNDGSIDDAILSMPDLLADDPADIDPATGYARAKPATDRGDDGKFKAKDEKPEEQKLDVKPEEKAPAEEEDSDYIEFPGENEGDAPVRHKLDEVIEGWQKAKTLEAELAEAKKVQPAQPLPSEIEQNVVALQKERADAVKAMKQWQQMMQPVAPNRELINENSQNYNPAEFNRQLHIYERQLAYHQAVSQRIEAAENQTKAEQETLRASKIARETVELQKIWPEVLSSEQVRAETAKQLFDHYKIDQALLDSDVTLDHRFYALAKDALAYRASQAKKVEAVKAVKAKPRLIQGQARQSSPSPKVQKFTQAYDSLTKSGSLEDAADALEGLL